MDCADDIPGLPLSLSNLSISPVTQSARAASTKAKNKGRHPYEVAQSKQRKAANMSRRLVLEKERASTVGDPVMGAATPFTESLMRGYQLGEEQEAKETAAYLNRGKPAHGKGPVRYNYFLTADEIKEGLEYSKTLSKPIDTQGRSGEHDPQQADEAVARHEEEHANAQEAIDRIVQLRNSSGRDRTLVNVQRCIEEFGRHNTAQVLAPKPVAAPHPNAPPPAPSAKKARAGPDTGSSEVQAAVLTAKILVLARQLEATGHKDKHNKRNLRVMVHKRQKHLSYLRRKERGGPRFQNVMDSLGLTDAAWKGEISM